MSEAQTSVQTMAVYNRDAINFVGKYCRDHEPDACEMAHEMRFILAARRFMNSHGVWSKNYIRRLALALRQHAEMLEAMDLIRVDSANSDKPLSWLLSNQRPKSVKEMKKAVDGIKTKKTDPEEKQRKTYRKSIPVIELRGLIEYFRARGNAFSLWIAGYIIVASRIGWRPGEIVVLRREGKFIRAQAEKKTNNRGLYDTCEIDISAYPPRLIAELDRWIADIATWEVRYGGLWDMRAAMNGRLNTACKALGIARTASYTFRQFAIACMKRSGFSRVEIAVLVNHASDRTASERYGKARDGIKRAKKMLRFQKDRLTLVREKPRKLEDRIAKMKKIPPPPAQP